MDVSGTATIGIGALSLLDLEKGCVFEPVFITGSSIMVFQALHEGHLPNHFGDSYPQSWQKKADFDFDTSTKVGEFKERNIEKRSCEKKNSRV